MGHNYDAFIIHRPKYLPPSLKGNMNQLNTLHVNEPTNTPRYWNSQPLSVHLKSQTSPPNNSPVILAIMVRLNHYVIDNGNAEVYPSDYSFNLPQTLFHIWVPLQSNQFMMIKCTNS